MLCKYIVLRLFFLYWDLNYSFVVTIANRYLPGFWWYWGLNLGACACYPSALLLEPCLQLFLLLGYLSQRVSLFANLGLWSSCLCFWHRWHPGIYYHARLFCWEWNLVKFLPWLLKPQFAWSPPPDYRCETWYIYVCMCVYIYMYIYIYVPGLSPIFTFW
jgi:hypothetical protein